MQCANAEKWQVSPSRLGAKKGARPPDRAHQGRDDLETARRHRCFGPPLRMFLTAGQGRDYIGARALLDTLPPAKHLPADRGYDADWYREALEDKGIKPCIPSRKGREVAIPHDEVRYRKRHRIENSFARLKDWRRVATRHDRCPQGVPVSLRPRRRRHVLVVDPEPKRRRFYRFAMAGRNQGDDGPVPGAAELEAREYTDLLEEAYEEHAADECGWCAKHRDE